MGLGAGVGGDAGADGSRGFASGCGVDEVFGVKGGLGCWAMSALRAGFGPMETGAGAYRPCPAPSLFAEL